MNLWLKFALGLALALAVAIVSHGPLGRGEAFVDRLDAGAQSVVRRAGLPDLSATMRRDPLARTVIMTGATNRFQRTGRLSDGDRGDTSGEMPGLDDRLLAVPGMGRVEWTSPPTGD